MNKISKVVVLSSSRAERIGTTDKMSIIIRAAAIDIENNLLPMQSLKVFVDEELVDKSISDETGELTLMIQRKYKPSSEVLVQIEHEASKIRSPKKIIFTPTSQEHISLGTQQHKEVSKNTKQGTVKKKEGNTKNISETAAIIAIKQNGLLLKNKKYRHLIDQKNIVIEAVKQNGLALEFASARLKNDIDIFNIAIEKNTNSALLADEELYNKYKLALEKAKSKGIIDGNFKDNKILVLCALQKDTNDFNNISDRLKDDEDIIKTAVQKNGLLLSRTTDKWKKNKEVVLLAIQNNAKAVYYIDESLQKDPDIILSIIKYDINLINILPRDILDNKEIVMAAIQKNPDILGIVPDKLKKDREVIKAAIQKDGTLIRYVIDHINNDKEIIIAALQQNGLALAYLPDKRRDNKNIVLIAVKQNPNAINYIGEFLLSRFKELDKELIIATMSKENKIQYTSFRDNTKTETIWFNIMFRGSRRSFYVRLDDTNMLNTIINTYPELFQNISEVQNNKIIALAAVTKNPYNIRYCSEELQKDPDIRKASGR